MNRLQRRTASYNITWQDEEARFQGAPFHCVDRIRP